MMKKKKKITAKKYLEILERKRIRPNWWCSEEYFEKAGFTVVLDWGIVYVYDKTGIPIFPGIVDDDHPYLIEFDNSKGFWAGFSNLTCDGNNKLLDYEYIYNPRSFLNMKGKKWSTFRKNSKKFPNRCGEILEYRRIEIGDLYQLKEVFFEWCENFEAGVEDGDVLVNFVFHGFNQMGLFGHSSGNLYGINIWDENYTYINYRYCICKNIPFLSEYLRLVFYLEIQNINKLVNDGGVLGRENLKRFKGKMNPLQINEIY